MQARKLKKLLNNTGYTVNNQEDKICVGSPYVSDLISVNKKTLELKYALDTWKEGRKALEGKTGSAVELLSIWDKLKELIESGEIKDIIEKDDVLENPLPVFTVEQGKLIETFTDKYGYPNVTITGDLMYENTYFKNRIDAIKYGIEDMEIGLKWNKEAIEEKEKEIQKIKDRFETKKQNLAVLRSLLN